MLFRSGDTGALKGRAGRRVISVGAESGTGALLAHLRLGDTGALKGRAGRRVISVGAESAAGAS